MIDVFDDGDDDARIKRHGAARPHLVELAHFLQASCLRGVNLQVSIGVPPCPPCRSCPCPPNP